jgi:hypothetical protein
MEFWARWAHRALWHASLWNMHESHHKPREGPFELNDIFAIINAVPAITLMAFGFFNHGFVPGLCFGGVSKYTACNCCSKLILQNVSNVFAWQVLFSGQFVQYPVMQTLAESKTYFCLCNRV